MKLFPYLLFIALLTDFNSLAQTSEKQKRCFVCNGTGQEKCTGGCAEGKHYCPSPCLKLNVGKWEKLKVAGHDPNELWQSFHYKAGGKSGTLSWPQTHVGDIIDARPGMVPTNKGRCPTCKGTTKIDCPKCKGTGNKPCHMCDGKKKIPEFWTETNNPKIDSDPNYIRLKDGRLIHGKIIMTLGDTIVIKPDQGKNIEIARDQIIPKSSAPKN